MQKIRYANTDTMISNMALGCLWFGSKLNKEDSYKLLDQYIAEGGNVLDTANNYVVWTDGGKGDESEKLIGQYLKDRKCRDKIFLITKVGAMVRDKKNAYDSTGKLKDDWLDHVEGLSKKAIISAVEESLINLQTDYLDLYFAHLDDRDAAQEETMEAFESLIKAGKVRNIGCSNFMSWRVERANQIAENNNWTKFTCIQQQHSYLRAGTALNPDHFMHVSDEVLDYCKNNPDLALFAYAPTIAGAYENPERRDPETNFRWAQVLMPGYEERLNKLVKMAEEMQVTATQLVLAWMMQTNPRAVPLIAVSSEMQLKDNLKASEIKLTAEQIKELDKA